MAPLSVCVDREAARLVLRVAGELDILTAPTLRAELARLPGRDLVVDLSRVDFFGGIGISILLDVQQRLCGAGYTLTLRRPTRLVRRLLTACELDAVLAVETDPVTDLPTEPVAAGVAGA